MRSIRLAWLLACVAGLAQAEVTGFGDTHSGVLLGGGTWFHLLPTLDKWNPVPELAPAALTLTGADGVRLLPLKLGFFKDLPGRSFIEIWGRYVISMSNAWTSSDGAAGATKFSSIGGGASTGFSFYQASRFRMQFVANTEYILQRVHITHDDEALNVRARNFVAGGGLQMELWAVDTWIISAFGGYQYGFPGVWSTAADGILFGQTQSGVLKNPQNDEAIVSRGGGVLAEVTFKLVMN